MRYDNLAVDVVNCYCSSIIQNPQQKDELIQIWDQKAQISSLSKASDCPKSTFLGLCTGGYIIGIPPISYSSSYKNRLYGETAVSLLKAFPFIANLSSDDLWQIVTKILSAAPNLTPASTHNYQMEVVLGLWKAGLIK